MIKYAIALDNVGFHIRSIRAIKVISETLSKAIISACEFRRAIDNASEALSSLISPINDLVT